MPEPGLEQLRIDRSSPATRPRRAKRLWLLLAAAVLLLAAGALASRYAGETAVETVSVTTAYPYQAVTLLNAAGYVVAQRKAAIASKATGRLEWLGVVEGSVVKEGEVIARIENRDVSAAAEQARANVAVARAELHDAEAAYKRAKELVAQKYVSPSALDAAEARYLKAKAGVSAAQAGARVAEVAVEQTLIRAPFDGVVLTKNANVGDTVTPFSASIDTKGAVVTVADMATLEVEADVSESNLQKIGVNQPCEIQLDAFPEMRFRGTVARLVPTVDRSKATVMTKVRFVERDLRILPEMSAKVAFLSKEVPEAERKPRTVVNPEAVVTRDGSSVVFVVAEGRARAVAVQTAERLGEAVALSGVKPGDKVVLRPEAKLRDGAAVKTAQKP
jgi:RND family efflux transporter MFP subunit